MKRKLIIAVACCCVIAAAQVGVGHSATEPGNYYPLAVGNEWTWVSVSGAVTGDTAAGLTMTQVWSQQVVAESVVGPGASLFQLVSRLTTYRELDSAPWIGSCTFPDTFYLLWTPTRLLRYGNLRIQPDTLLVIPFVAGNRWTKHRGENFTTEFTAIGPEAVSTPVGAFTDAWRIEIATGVSLSASEWYVQGIGPVKTEVHPEASRHTIQLMELVAYKVE